MRRWTGRRVVADRLHGVAAVGRRAGLRPVEHVAHDGQRLCQPAQPRARPVAVLEAEGGVLRLHPGGTDAQHGPSAADVVDGGDHLGQQGRVAEGVGAHEVADGGALRLGGHRGHGRVGLDGRALPGAHDGVDVVPGEEGVEAQVLGSQHAVEEGRPVGVLVPEIGAQLERRVHVRHRRAPVCGRSGVQEGLEARPDLGREPGHGLLVVRGREPEDEVAIAQLDDRPRSASTTCSDGADRLVGPGPGLAVARRRCASSTRRASPAESRMTGTPMPTVRSISRSSRPTVAQWRTRRPPPARPAGARPPRLQASAYSATSRSVTLRPLPPMRMGRCAWTRRGRLTASAWTA